MRRLTSVVVTLALLPGAGVARAQGRWSLEASAGAAFATQKLGEADLGTGVGLDLIGRYRFMPHLSAYAGWDWHHFPSDDPVAGGDADFEDTGYTFGMRFEHPFAGKTSYWLRLGGTAKHIEVENGEGDIISDTGHGLGWEAGAGMTIPIGTRTMLTPGVRYRALSRDLEVGSASTPVDLKYVNVGLGLAYRF